MPGRWPGNGALRAEPSETSPLKPVGASFRGANAPANKPSPAHSERRGAKCFLVVVFMDDLQWADDTEARVAMQRIDGVKGVLAPQVYQVLKVPTGEQADLHWGQPSASPARQLRRTLSSHCWTGNCAVACGETFRESRSPRHPTEYSECLQRHVLPTSRRDVHPRNEVLRCFCGNRRTNAPPPPWHMRQNLRTNAARRRRPRGRGMGRPKLRARKESVGGFERICRRVHIE